MSPVFLQSVIRAVWAHSGGGRAGAGQQFLEVRLHSGSQCPPAISGESYCMVCDEVDKGLEQ